MLRASTALLRAYERGIIQTKEDGGGDDFDVKTAIGEFSKAANDRFAKLEKNIDDCIAAIQRPRQFAGDVQGQRDTGSAKAWDGYLRKGFTQGFEAKALSAGDNTEGGFLIPEQWANKIVETVFLTSPMRAICNIENVSTQSLEILVDKDEPGAEWVGEQSARPETTTPKWAALSIPVFEMYALPKASQIILEDSRINLEDWLTKKVGPKFARKETTAFVSGNGVTQPRGFLSETMVANASWAWGKIGYIATGVNGGFAASNPIDNLISLKFALKAPYRAGAVWLMNSTTASVIEKFKDTTGQPIWRQGATAAAPDMLLGFPVVIAEDMPDMSSNGHAVAFGNFREGYTIVDRLGISVLRDPFTAKPHVLFYSRKRVGGMTTNFEAIKTLKFATS
ncbi:MAG: phage major capsid protein [Alphaproteobacteria bacterium]|nr:phage major capsid protein [Alphaproteobacteria bacterium]